MSRYYSSTPPPIEAFACPGKGSRKSRNEYLWDEVMANITAPCISPNRGQLWSNRVNLRRT